MKYPFTKCINPQKIRNPHTGDWLKVPCGKCEACKNSKSSLQSMKCKLETLSHKYCMFVTLTYDNDNIPRIRLLPHEPDEYGTSDLYYAVQCNPRLSDGVVLFDIELDDVAKLFLSQKFQHEDYPVLYKRDAQLFIKRLRKHLSKYSNEKIRYYIIGEYGPQHFRPHYHALIWFDREETFTHFGCAISASWKFGRVDWSLSRGNCAQYVAQYVNGSVPLPRVFTFDETEPFALHSFYLGEAVLATKSKDIPKEEFANFTTRRIHFGNAFTEFSVWRSYESHFFPKCYRFGQLNEFECIKAYRTYECASEWTGQTSVAKQVKDIMSMLEYGVGNDDKFFEYLRNTYKITADTFKSQLTKDTLFRQLYLSFSVSKQFLTHVCRNNSLGEIKNRIHYIKDYYAYKDSACLKKQLTLENEILRNPSCDDINVALFFDIVEPKSLSLQNEFQSFVLTNDRDVYEESALVRQFRAEAYKISHDKIKHKKLNDLNNIFTNL